MSKILFKSGCIKVLIAVFCFAIMTVPNASAQEEESDAPAPKHSLKDGAWALQFQLGSALSRRGYDGIAFSAKYHLTKESAIRLGIDINGHIHFGRHTSHRGIPPDDTLYTSSRDNMNLEGINLKSEYLKYTQIDPKLHFFLGTGPTLGFLHRKSKRNDWRTYPPEPKRPRYISEEYNWSLGISALLGAEWFPTKRISFMAEYGVSFDYTYAIRKSEYTTDEGVNFNRSRYHMNYFALDLLRAKIGIAVYL
jgi:hypothetical protein